MKPILILYGTKEGQTRRIAEHLAKRLRERDLVVEVHDAAHLAPGFDLDAFETAILAAPIHVGRHEPRVAKFAQAHREKLTRMGAAFLSVSLSQAGAEDPKRSAAQRARAQADIAVVLAQFFRKAGWTPELVKPIAGALLYTQYSFPIRFVMRLISKSNGGPTDTSRDYELTNWAELDRFVDTLSSRLPTSQSRQSPIRAAPAFPLPA